MKRLDSIVREQVHYLENYGYSEKALGNNLPPYAHFRDLKEAVQHTLDGDKTLFDDEKIKLNLFGVYNAGKDKVHFALDYSFNSYTEQLKLQSVTATLNKTVLEIPVETGSDLWPSQDIYFRLKSLSETITLASHQVQLKKLDDQISKLGEWLTIGGYISPTNLSKQIKSQVLNNGVIRPTTINMVLGSTLKQSDMPSLEIRFHIAFYPDDRGLDLKSLHASVGPIKELWIRAKHMKLPKYDMLKEHMKELYTTQKAIQLIAAETTTSPSLSKKL
ncbi:hypothetical protein [Paraflavitalea sp. CAU 1676]|uniref:hypothetical protein n=1 Tax=Paraflavitalea sp. CAU 1676 TaxID=3032598 RepID=UPI0023DAA825|nr:hypothetical protein [Paraflavitalea sp. CAU 1676]MDF2191367.1 hypothetical protein [Paraflavitalea sp. CAU 1676]